MRIKIKIVMMCLVVLIFTFVLGSSYVFKDLEGLNMYSYAFDNCMSALKLPYSDHRYGYISLGLNDKFNKGTKITRSELAEMIFKIENLDYGDDYVFLDTKDNVYVGIISAIVKRGYMEANFNDQFLPDNYLTRADFINIVMNIIKNNKTILINKTIREYEDNFDDIENDVHRDSIIKCYEYGLINGNNANKFRPFDFVTKEEAIVILNMVYGYDKGDILKMIDEYNKNPYSDIAENYWAYEDIVRATVGLEY